MIIIGPEDPELFDLELGSQISTNINQSVPNLIKMNTTIRSWMSSIMDIIRPELSKLSTLELENLAYLTVYTLASANIHQSAPNLITV